jgi:hypothetical protein
MALSMWDAHLVRVNVVEQKTKVESRSVDEVRVDA